MYQTLKIKRMKNSKSKSFRFVASTSASDRYNDVIDQEGWDLKGFNANPIVLFNHNSLDLPIGRGKVEVKNNQLMIEVEFDQSDEFAKKIEQKVKDGFINAVSVGFNPIEATPRSSLDKNHKYYSKFGTLFSKAELLEVSIVTIPANSEATMAKSIQKGLKGFIRQVVQEEIKHILEVEFLDDGNYRVTFEGMPEEEMPTEEMPEEEMPVEEEAYKEDEKDMHEEDQEDEVKNLLAQVLKHLKTKQ